MPERSAVSERRVPPASISSTSTLETHTGSWKYIRPVYQDKVAPCNAGCPVGIDIEGYMNLLRDGCVEEACDLLLRENPMPAVTGRVCHHPCETVCNRRSFDGAVSIHAVERQLGDLALENASAPMPVLNRGERVAIVGSGPAGLACAYHLARLGYPVTVFEAAAEPGGMLRLGIPAYRLPRAVLDAEIDRIRALGVEFRCSVRIGVDRSWDNILGGFDAVFVASGAHVARPLGVEGEDGPGVRSGLEFLKEVNRGERPDIGGTAVVVGGGNTAIDCARTALRLGANAIVLYRRTRAEMPAIEQEVEEAVQEGVQFVFLAAPVAFTVEHGKLRNIECVPMRLGEPDDSGRRRPIPVGEERFCLDADTVLTAIGEEIDMEALPAGMERRRLGVRVTRLGKTSRAAVFAGGDLTDAPRTVADALGAGKRSAIGIDRYLRGSLEPLKHGGTRDLFYGSDGNVSMTRWRGDDPIQRVAPVNEVIELGDLNTNHFERRRRSADRWSTDSDGWSQFAEVNLGLDRTGALAEARRCFNCGVCIHCDLCLIFCPDVAISRRANGDGYEIALEYCKGCGVCVEECPRGAMIMVREAR